ncbi:MAG: peptidoglycan DD-metalloendopeptidase family protein [Solobacterium sp.]|nr:peptidoglycan DD-metalloendopeptidase family protein [Solobacterium sp.]
MEALKKLTRIALSLVLCTCAFLPYHVQAEDEYDFSDRSYWTDLCTGQHHLTDDQKKACTAYMNYVGSQSSDLNRRLKDIESQRSEVMQNLSYYGQQVAGYQAQANALNAEIAQYNQEIAVKEALIQELEEKIAQSQAQIDEVQSRITERMVLSQPTMRLNKYLDILMGARSFNDFIRIAKGLDDITAYDNAQMAKLADLIEQMNKDIVVMEEEKVALAEARQKVVDAQNEILVMMYQVQVVEEEYRRQAAALQAEAANVAAGIEELQAMMNSIADKLNEIAPAPGWTYPVAAGFINPVAGTWYYASGGLHLGADFVANKGTALLAAGNGVILNSVNGCGDGWLGNGCVGPGGSWGGGNQIHALYKINGGLYAVSYSHMLINTPIPKGTVVHAGDKVGEVGTSGNSTGPHCHLEVYYLGSADNFTYYAQHWNGDLSFGCGWYSAALNHICENGSGAPCRVRPESVFGG